MTLILGTVQFGLPYGVTNTAGKPSLAQVFAVLDSAWENGVRVLDSAQGYGAANQVIAQYHAQRSHRFGVINKVLRQPAEINSIYEALTREREALLIDEFECVMFHYPPSVGPDIPDDFFSQLHTRGISRRAGLSVESPQEYQGLKQRFSFNDVQLPLNPINQKFITDSFLNSLAENQVSVHARSAFLQGLLLAKTSVPSYLKPLSLLIDRMAYDSERLGISMIAACFIYVLQKNPVSHVVVGAQDVQQWLEIVDAYKKAEAIKDSITLPWHDYACNDFDLVHPVQWEKLKTKGA